MDELTPSLIALLEAFRTCFRQEVFSTFRSTIAAWFVCLGTRTISRVWETTGQSESESHCRAYRLFSEATWNWDELCRILLLMLLEAFVPGVHVWIAVDDTLCHKRGAKVAFGGIFLDAVLSSKKHKNFRFGNNWVTLTLVVKLPFRSDRYFAQPILWRIYQKKGKDNTLDHRTKVELAAEMIALVAGWIPSHTITLVADDAYRGQKLLKKLPENVQVIGPLRWNAKLFEKPGEDAHPNSKKGERLPTPKTILGDDQKYPAQQVTIEFLGCSKVLEVKRVTDILWYDVRHTSPVQIVLVRDPEGKWRDEALACTDLSLDIATIISGYCRRWAIELSYRDAKQFLGFHDPQVYCEKSVERTAPMAWFLSSLLMLWYWREGKDCPQAERHRPWYQSKRGPTFSDMLATMRLSLWNHWLDQVPIDGESVPRSSDDAERHAKLAWLIEYLSTAA